MVFSKKNMSVGIKDNDRDKALTKVAALSRLMNDHPMVHAVQKSLLDGQEETPENIEKILNPEKDDMVESIQISFESPVYLVKAMLGIVYKSHELLEEVNFMDFEDSMKLLQKEGILKMEEEL